MDIGADVINAETNLACPQLHVKQGVYVYTLGFMMSGSSWFEMHSLLFTFHLQVNSTESWHARLLFTMAGVAISIHGNHLLILLL